VKINEGLDAGLALRSELEMLLWSAQGLTREQTAKGTRMMSTNLKGVNKVFCLIFSSRRLWLKPSTLCEASVVIVTDM
jgi:hypothetical protein